MEVYWELSERTTILVSPELHRRLEELAEQSGVGMGRLIREACEDQYGIVDSDS